MQLPLSGVCHGMESVEASPSLAVPVGSGQSRHEQLPLLHWPVSTRGFKARSLELFYVELSFLGLPDWIQYILCIFSVMCLEQLKCSLLTHTII